MKPSEQLREGNKREREREREREYRAIEPPNLFCKVIHSLFSHSESYQFGHQTTSHERMCKVKVFYLNQETLFVGSTFSKVQ